MSEDVGSCFVNVRVRGAGSKGGGAAAPAVEAAADFHGVAISKIEGAGGLLCGHVHLELHWKGFAFPDVVEVGDWKFGRGRGQNESAVGIIFPDVGAAITNLDELEFDRAAGLVGDVGGGGVKGGTGLRWREHNTVASPAIEIAAHDDAVGAGDKFSVVDPRLQIELERHRNCQGGERIQNNSANRGVSLFIVSWLTMVPDPGKSRGVQKKN